MQNSYHNGLDNKFLEELTNPLPVETKVKMRAPMGMSNFTPRAQQVLALARKEADRFNHNFVGSEHLLPGLIAFGQGCAVNALKKLGLDLENVRAEVEKHLSTGPDQKIFGNIPYTPGAKTVLTLANKERQSLNHAF